ncbi:sensor histidine kinase [Ramlibacter alkalitolerans]|uniref:Histidine kinase n=1 Tax=Ramlibacter alkalitolerans TaxID=2039631 RepID=A0ABS1JJC4_9BURK|nr:histidine kinase [Ramlibacter alkalitolerans]MBL0424314.1 histidine kinase [Ramlibacter alkalitolerans]
MTIDWVVKLRHLLQTLAFCLTVATLQYAFAPDHPYAPPVVYSLLIGVITWAVIDLGREFMPSARETGWPLGWQGFALVACGILAGWFVGTHTADLICRTFRLYGPWGRIHSASDLRADILITLIAGTIGSYWFYARNKSAYLLRRMREAERHANDARLKLLETQLEPHMMFNTLANLRALIGVDPVRAQQMLDHMIAYLRATLDASRATTHSLRAEFDRLHDYLELMAIRMGPRLSYVLELPPELADVPVPALLLQPLVENSIKHGLEPKVEGGRIEVRARRDGRHIVIEVCDSGVGANGHKGSGKGFGLVQIRERLAALHGPQASLDFATDPGGAQARIALPLAA